VHSLRQNVEQVFAEIDTEDFSEDVRRQYITGFMRFVNDLDASRGLSFRSVAPEIHEAVSAHCGGWDESYRYFGSTAALNDR